MALVEEEISLREAKQNDDINDGEGKHVTSNHGINHRNERSSQSDGTRKLKINRSDCFSSVFSTSTRTAWSTK